MILQSKYCEKCKYKEFTYVPPSLVKNSDLLIVGQNPGAEEQEEGKVFMGKCGQFLRNYLTSFDKKGIIYSITNALKCGTPNNKTPTKKELEICKPLLLQDIEYCSPKLILTLGKCAFISLTGKIESITPLIGHILYEYPVPILVGLHPSAVTGYGKDRALFEKGILPALKFFDTKVEMSYKVENSIPAYNFPVGLDIETTSLCPYKGKIRSVSVSNGKKGIFAEVEDE